MKSNVTKHNLCMLGFGNVGRALARLLVEKRDELRERFRIDFRVTGAASRRMGWLVAPEGFDEDELATGDLRADERSAGERRAVETFEDWLAEARPDVMFEATSLEPTTGEPAVSRIRAAIGAGAHIVTANKGPVVHAHRELAELAAQSRRRFFHEAAVADCLPVFSLFRETLPLARLRGFSGLLNSTTNIILESVAAGGTFDEGVQRARSLGVTETDPAYDVDGWDAAVKTCALANVLMDADLKLDDVRREGVRELNEEEVRAASAEGRPYRLVARARRDEAGRVEASVGPERVEPAGPFASLGGTTLAVHFELDVLRGLTLVAHHPDLRSTAYAMLADFVNAVSER